MNYDIYLYNKEANLKQKTNTFNVNKKNIYSVVNTVFSCSKFRYPIVSTRDKCAGDLDDLPGVRSYGVQHANEHYDVYCYMDKPRGMMVPTSMLFNNFRGSYEIWCNSFMLLKSFGNLELTLYITL